MFSEDRNKYLASFGEFDLLIIDDLEIERNSEYAQEQVYNVVDSRYLSRLPFIIITNLTLAELKEPKDIAHARIYNAYWSVAPLSAFRAGTTAQKMQRTPIFQPIPLSKRITALPLSRKLAGLLIGCISISALQTPKP